MAAPRKMTPEAARLRAKIAALSRCISTGERRADDPEFLDAKRDFAAEQIYTKISRALNEGPPFTQAQKDRLLAIIEAAPGT